MNENVDVRLKLLRGSSIRVDGLGEIKPLTLGEIVDMSYLKYQQYLRILTIKLEDIPNFHVFQENGKDIFDILISSQDVQLTTLFIESLKCFLREDNIHINIPFGIVFLGELEGNTLDRVIDKSIFAKLKDVIEMQNCLKGNVIPKYNAVNDKAQSIIEKLKQSSEYINKLNGKSNSDDIDISDIISAVSVKSTNVNKFNVWDFTLYQLYDEYKRLDIIGQHDISIQSILHGADMNKVQMKHWSSKID